jgi:AAA+ ATPase superfamily predicted ATPase
LRRSDVRFYDRKWELSFLDERWMEKKTQFIIVYGRRRVGKTEILKQFIRDKPAVYFLGDRRPERDQLRELSRRLGTYFGDEFVGRKGFTDWLEAFEYLQSRTKKPFILVIDEYPYLVEGNRATSSLFQKGWDETLRTIPLFLILCGSSMAMMELETLAHRSPLYGRRTGDLLVQPLDFTEAWAFFPRLSFEEMLAYYTVLGGVPAYLLQFNPRKPLATNVRDNILTRGTFLFREVEFLLKEELREPRNYLAILKAIASGRRKFGEIVNDTGLQKNVLHKYLHILEDLRLVERETPVTERKPLRSKRSLYRLDDAFVAFWLEYVYPYKSDLELGDPSPSLREFRKSFPHHLSHVYELVSRELLLRTEGLPFSLQRIGRWWDRNEEIDIVGLNEESKGILFGEVKWSTKAVGIDIYHRLREKSQRVEWKRKGRREVFALFSKSGFTRQMLQVARKEKVILFHQNRRLR